MCDGRLCEALPLCEHVSEAQAAAWTEEGHCLHMVSVGVVCGAIGGRLWVEAV